MKTTYVYKNNRDAQGTVEEVETKESKSVAVGERPVIQTYLFLKKESDERNANKYNAGDVDAKLDEMYQKELSRVKPKKKKSKAPLIIGIVVGVLVLIGASCGVGGYFLIKNANEKAATERFEGFVAEVNNIFTSEDRVDVKPLSEDAFVSIYSEINRYEEEGRDIGDLYDVTLCAENYLKDSATLDALFYTTTSVNDMGYIETLDEVSSNAEMYYISSLAETLKARCDEGYAYYNDYLTVKSDLMTTGLKGKSVEDYKNEIDSLKYEKNKEELIAIVDALVEKQKYEVVKANVLALYQNPTATDDLGNIVEVDPTVLTDEEEIKFQEALEDALAAWEEAWIKYDDALVNQARVQDKTLGTATEGSVTQKLDLEYAETKQSFYQMEVDRLAKQEELRAASKGKK